MSEWKEYRLGDVTEWASGGTPSKKNADYWDGNIPWISAISMKGNRYSQSKLLITEAGLRAGSRLAEKDSVLLLVRGSTLHQRILVGIAECNVAFNQDVKSIKAKEEYLDSWYLLFWFMSIEKELLNMVENTGIGAGKLDTKLLQNLIINIPPKEERDRINACAKAVDDKLILNRQINQTLEQIAQALFKSWFVDFEPVKAKIIAQQKGGDEKTQTLAAQGIICGALTLEQLQALAADKTELKTELQTTLINHLSTGSGLAGQTPEALQKTAALFPNALVESELGEVPERWKAKPFGEFLSRTIGGDWGKEEPDEKHTEKVKILRGTDLPNVYAGSDGRVPTRYVTAKKLATRKLDAGDIVIEVSGGSPTQPTGRSLYLTQEIVERLNADLEPASFCRLFRPVDDEIGLMLGLHLQKIYGDGKTWLYQNTSTGISNFQTTVFLEKELVVVPPEEIKRNFYELVMPYIQKISSSENKILAELRDALLPKLLSGELSLKPNQTEIEKII